MKTASRILTIVSMIATPISCLFTGIFLSAGGYAVLFGSGSSQSQSTVIPFATVLAVYIVMAIIFTVACEVTGSILLRKLESANSKSEVIAPAVWALIFCSALGGIFALCTRESDFGLASSATIEDSEHTGCC